MTRAYHLCEAPATLITRDQLNSTFPTLEGRAENAAGMYVFKTCGLVSSPRQLSRISRSSFGTPYTSLCMLASVMCGRGRERERERGE
jgi:hypothetical protein